MGRQTRQARVAGTLTRSTAWMMGRMQGLEARLRHMGIDLGSGQVAMPQQHLHHAQVGAMIEQMRGEGMTQRMG